MIGSIIGDIIGSRWEFETKKPKYNFKLFTNQSHFTDDTVLTIAVMNKLILNSKYPTEYKKMYFKYPNLSYGKNFRKWCYILDNVNNSWGNGSAMRIAPVGWWCNEKQEVIEEATLSAVDTHNHPDGIKGAVATALTVFLARTTHSKHIIKKELSKYYDLNFNLNTLIKTYKYDVSCNGTVPQAIYCLLESSSFEDAIRLTMTIGGDSDTLGSIIGGMAEAFYGVENIPEYMKTEVLSTYLDDYLFNIVNEFYKKINIKL